MIEALNGPSTPTHRVVPSAPSVDSNDNDGVVVVDSSVGVIHASAAGDNTLAAAAAAPGTGTPSRSALANGVNGATLSSSSSSTQARPSSTSSSSHRSKRRSASARAASGRGSGRSNALGSREPHFCMVLRCIPLRIYPLEDH